MSSNSNSTNGGTPRKMRTVFGIIMIIVYLGVGVLFLTGFFEMPWTWAKWVCGGLLIAYGIWRGYRQFAGLDPEYGPGYEQYEHEEHEHHNR